MWPEIKRNFAVDTWSLSQCEAHAVHVNKLDMLKIAKIRNKLDMLTAKTRHNPPLTLTLEGHLLLPELFCVTKEITT